MAETASSTEFYLPSEVRTVYSSYEQALAVLKELDYEITPIRYGEVFPYEGITFKDHLDQKGYAFYGYGEREIDDETYPMAIGLLYMGAR